MDITEEDLNWLMIDRIVEHRHVLLNLGADVLLDLYKHTIPEIEKVDGEWRKKVEE